MIVSRMTRGPAKPICARGSAMITSPRLAKLADTPPVVGLLMIEHNGIKTIGALAVLGIVSAMLSALVVVPSIVGRRT